MNRDKHLDAFLKVLDSRDTTTGGGSASSIAGAMAAGLAGMVARLSLGKKDLEPTEHYEALADEAESLGQELLVGGSRDSEAFAVVSAAFALPKGSDQEKAARSRAIKKGMTLCAQVPLQNAVLCRRVLDLCHRLDQSYNSNAASDLECARQLAQAGLAGCAANVRVNLPHISDEQLVKELETRLEAVLDPENA